MPCFVDDSQDEVLRFDSAKLGSKVQVTQQGFLRVPANLTKVGVVEYQRMDGTIRRELRLPEEVFAPESIATLSMAPVTIDHPYADPHGPFVNAENVQALQAGNVEPGSKPEGDSVAGFIVVSRTDAIADVRSRKLTDLSPGYTAHLERSPGVYKGQPYDVIQRRIRYNHVALLPKDGGRQGGDVALRLDSAYEVPSGTAARTGENTVKLQVRLGQIDFPVDVADALAQPFQSSIAALERNASDGVTKLTDVQARLDKRDAEVIALTGQLKDATDPAKIESMLEAAVAVRLDATDALRISGIAEEDITEKLKGLSTAAVKSLVLKELNPELRLDGKSADYVSAAFDTTIASVKQSSLGTTEGTAITLPSVGEGVRRQRLDAKRQPARDEADDTSSDAARKRMLERNRTAWEPKVAQS